MKLQTSWYKELLEDLRKLEFNGIVLTKWNIGKRIATEEKNPEYGEKTIKRLAEDLGTSASEIWGCMRFFKKFPTKEKLDAVQQLSWRDIWHKYLPEPKKVSRRDNIPLPEGKYNVIYADPPWEVKAGPDWGSGEESKDLLYPTMTLEEIKNLPVKKLAADDSHLYLWVINKYIQESYDVARSWGFEPSCLLTWCKPPHGIGLGGTFIQTTEHLLFCRRGNLEAKKRIDTTWFKYPRGRHSEKPKEFREMIEEVSPGKKIELFARQKTKGWDVWGNEV